MRLTKSELKAAIEKLKQEERTLGNRTRSGESCERINDRFAIGVSYKDSRLYWHVFLCISVEGKYSGFVLEPIRIMQVGPDRNDVIPLDFDEIVCCIESFAGPLEE